MTIKTVHYLYCDGTCATNIDAENPDASGGETKTEVREAARKRSGFVQRRDPETGRLGDYCPDCASDLFKSSR